MKRCPSCKFIYLATDEVCDFDGTQLVLVDDKELEGSTAAESPATLAQRPVQGKGARTMALAAVVGLGLGVVMFLVYFAGVRRTNSIAQTVQPPVQIATPNQNQPQPSPSPSPSPSVEASPVAATDRHSDSPAPVSTRANVSRNPVSTSTQNGSGALIRLSNGSRIEADEVWRTREGVWYRRAGMVTLLKAGQVKAIEQSSRKQ